MPNGKPAMKLALVVLYRPSDVVLMNKHFRTRLVASSDTK